MAPSNGQQAAATTTAAAQAKSAGRRTWVRWQIFGILWILVLLNFIDRATLSIAMPMISEEFDLTPELKGVILGSFFWTYLLFQIPGGWLLDRFGPRHVVGSAGAIWGVFQLLGGLVPGAGMLTVTRLGLGATEAPVFPAGAKLNANWLPRKERARGATFIDAAGPFGSAVGGLLVTALIVMTGGWRWAFIITGAVTIVVAVLYWMYLRDEPGKHPRVNKAELDHITTSDDRAPEARPETGPLPRAVDYLRSRSFWGMMFGRLGWATIWWGIISWTPSYLDEALGFDLAALGWGTFLVYGAGVVGQLVAGFWSDRWRSTNPRHSVVMRTILAVSGVGTAVAIFLIPPVTDGAIALTLLSIAVFFINFGGLYWSIPALLAPKEQVGMVGGVMNVASSGGGAIAPIAMGFAIGASGGAYGGAFTFLGVCAVVYLVGSLIIDFERPLARRKASA
ncbi:MFS transporter [Agrococcus sp. ARC_14]|uniref:MFS transporter n=1 Tax=Agrococcus sp. ARC_14 TaxID=2919927 RepID=UPI001F0644E2|nr:MFS transporter [Agrococcus sp. ARC_14]MCH1883804.1 MFS transporter [Agrococcus sp. ARC_14]